MNAKNTTSVMYHIRVQNEKYARMGDEKMLDAEVTMERAIDLSMENPRSVVQVLLYNRIVCTLEQGVVRTTIPFSRYFAGLPSTMWATMLKVAVDEARSQR